MAEKSERKQPRRGAGKPFEPGKSGNPAGKPIGARNKTTLAIEKLLEGESEAITRQCIEMAKAGDGMAMRLVMERIAPLRRGRPVRFTLPQMEGPSDLVKAFGGILRAVADGELTPDEASTVAGIFDAKRRAIETTDIEARLAAIEKAAPSR
jgi:hypothetical protein